MIDPTTPLDIAALVESALGQRPSAILPLPGGCIADVVRADMPNGQRVVVKTGDPGSELDLEGWMLKHLAKAGWPIPDVLFAEPTMLILSYVENDGQMTVAAEHHAADLLAALHSTPQPGFGFWRLTMIAGLPQANPKSDKWVPFFVEHRLRAMADQALQSGQLSVSMRTRIDRLADQLSSRLIEPTSPSLIHGDLWGGNILLNKGRVVGVVDPACYWAHAEMELAFSTLFSTFGSAFFKRYNEHRPITPGFFEERRDIYNLYPLLVHVRLFGGTYVGSVDRILKRFGV